MIEPFAASRRRFLGATGAAFAALAASGCVLRGPAGTDLARSYGPLQADPGGLIDLPARFSYRILSRLGDRMDDGATVPDKADGMGCLQLRDGRIVLVRNHELRAGDDSGGFTGAGYDTTAAGRSLPGGTTTLVLNPATLGVERQFRSLAGTIRNCAGGVTPWGSWLTCEEDVTRAGTRGATRDHGWVFEVPAAASGLVEPRPLTALGRFNHEAAAVDPASGIVYLTEDREDSLLYRFLPSRPGQLGAGGRLQALALRDTSVRDSRNWTAPTMAPNAWMEVRWIDLDGVESPDDDLRKRGHAAGALLFARGEGISMGQGEFYFACTSGGAKKLGQIFRLRPGSRGDRLQLFFESSDPAQLHYGDNLTVAPDGQLIVCEDQSGSTVDNHLRVIGPGGVSYPLARLRLQTELAGACFSPDGRTLFVNVFAPAHTLAISGPWQHAS